MYITRAGSDVYVSGNKIKVQVYEYDGDNGMEARLIGKVTESGRYRLTGKSTADSAVTMITPICMSTLFQTETITSRGK